MRLTHTHDFATFTPARQTDQTGPGDMLQRSVRTERHPAAGCFFGSTRLETPQGWRPVDALRKGDMIATLDGGFVAVRDLQVAPPAPAPVSAYHVPAGVMNTCSDLWLTENQALAVIAPECDRLFQRPCVLAPVSAMIGYRGITWANMPQPGPRYVLSLETEEIVFAQTGALVHVPFDAATPFFRTVSYGETRALLALIDGAHCAPDLTPAENATSGLAAPVLAQAA